MNNEHTTPDSADKITPTKHRSPNYPYIGLEDALKRLEQIKELGRGHFVSITAARTTWGYKRNVGDRTAAALKSYALIDVKGSAEKREIKPTEIGIKILEDHSHKPELLKQAALSPEIHKEVWDKYGGNFPDDMVIREYLRWDKKFNPDNINKFIQQLRDTITFANLTSSDRANIDLVEENEDGDNENRTFESSEIGSKKTHHLPFKDGEKREELNFKLAPASSVSIIFTSKQKVTQEDVDLLMKMLEVQKMAFPTAKDVEMENAAEERRERLIPEF